MLRSARPQLPKPSSFIAFARLYSSSSSSSAMPSNSTLFAVQDIVACDRYPIHDLMDNPLPDRVQKFISHVKSELKNTGKCLLQGFMRPDAVAETVNQVYCW